jgi:hypothetical protein
MSGPNPDSLNMLARLELLDGQVRRLRKVLTVVFIFFGIMLVLLALGVLLTRNQAGDRDTFVLRDEDGKRRAALVVAKGIPVLEFYDDGNNLLGGLKMAKEESSFVFFDQEQKLRGKLGTIKGRPSLFLYDRQGQIRVNLGLTSAGESLILHDAKGNIRAILAVDDKGPHFALVDEKGKPVFEAPKP